MKDLALRMAASIGLALTVSLLAAGSALAGWENGAAVDNQGEGTSSGSVGNFVAVADGGNGLASGYFEQTIGGAKAYYGIRRSASDAAWGTPQPIGFPPSVTTVSDTVPMAAAADGGGNALNTLVQGGQILASSWPASITTPANYQLILQDSNAPNLSDPAVTFDNAGNGYAVAGQPQTSGFADQPIWLSTYSPSTGWSSQAPVSVGPPPAKTSCTTSSTLICGREPRLAVSPDGTVVITYLKNVASPIPGQNVSVLFAVRAPAGAVLGPGGATKFVSQEQISGSTQFGPNQVPTSGVGNTPPNFDVAIDGSDTATIVDAESNNGGVSTSVFATRWPTGRDPSTAVQLSGSSPTEPPASEPRVVADPAGDATASWTESSPNPLASTLFAAEFVGSSWTTQNVSAGTSTPPFGGADSPNANGATPNQMPFALGEDAGGNAYLVWTNSGALDQATRQTGRGWSCTAAIANASSPITGDARVTAAKSGQADALWVGHNSSRTAAFASRFTGPLPPPCNTPPTATTGQATSISQTGATLNGTVNPQGTDTSYHFEYGTSNSYGTSTPTKDAGAGSSDVAVSAPLTGLTPGTTYHFRLVATSAAGTSVGSDMTFATTPAPGSPSVTTGPPTAISQTGATLGGTVNPRGSATKYHFEYGTTANYGKTTPLQDAGAGGANVNVSVPVTGLQPVTTYHYRLIASNSAGTTQGSDRTFATASVKPKPPSPCNVRPFSSIDRRHVRASRNTVSVSGTAGEPVCKNASAADRRRNRVIAAYVVISRGASRGRCQFLQRNGRLSGPGSCARPIELLARGTSNWSLRLRVRLAPGPYLVRSDAVDGFGRHQRRSAASIVRVVVPGAKKGARRRAPGS